MINKIYFFDIDGVLSVPIYNYNGKEQCCMPDESWHALTEGNIDSYALCQTLPSVLQYIEDIKNEDVILAVLSTETIENCKSTKVNFVERHYPNTFDAIFFVNKDLEKIDAIRIYAKQMNVPLGNCYLIEDTLKTLIAATTAGINPVHITNIVLEYDRVYIDRKKVEKHLDYLEEHGGTDSDIEDFCWEEDIPLGFYDKIMAERQFKGTPCEKCENNGLNLGHGSMGVCCSCKDNPKFKSYKKGE